MSFYLFVRNPNYILQKLKGLCFFMWLSLCFIAIQVDCEKVHTTTPVLPKETYKTKVDFDPITAHPTLVVSEDKIHVKSVESAQDVPDNPERFNSTPCLLGYPKFISGNHYWEVEFGEQREWVVGVANMSVERKVILLLKPQEGIWQEGLWWHRRMEPISHSVHPQPTVIGVFLDCEKGTVAFYMGNKVMQKSITSCTEGLRPFFCVGSRVHLTLK